MAPGILAPPELADRFRRLIEPVRVRQQRDQFDGAEEFHRVRFGLHSARSLPALTRMATSSVVQFKSLPPVPPGGGPASLSPPSLSSPLASQRHSCFTRSHWYIGFYKEPLPAGGGGRSAPTRRSTGQGIHSIDARHNSFGVKSTCPVFVAAGELNHSDCRMRRPIGNGGMNDHRSL